jgi:hypothetical protein
VLRSHSIISAVEAAVRRSQAFQLLRAQAVHTISGRSPALPQARSAPTPRAPQSSTLYCKVRQPVPPAGTAALPIRPSQVFPPSKERSSHTSSPPWPPSTVPQAMASVSLTCNRNVRPKRPTLTGARSEGARPGSRASQ